MRIIQICYLVPSIKAYRIYNCLVVVRSHTNGEIEETWWRGKNLKLNQAKMSRIKLLFVVRGVWEGKIRIVGWLQDGGVVLCWLNLELVYFPSLSTTLFAFFLLFEDHKDSLRYFQPSICYTQLKRAIQCFNSPFPETMASQMAFEMCCCTSVEYQRNPATRLPTWQRLPARIDCILKTQRQRDYVNLICITISGKSSLNHLTQQM
jgi:hypothetical protein